MGATGVCLATKRGDSPARKGTTQAIPDFEACTLIVVLFRR